MKAVAASKETPVASTASRAAPCAVSWSEILALPMEIASNSHDAGHGEHEDHPDQPAADDVAAVVGAQEPRRTGFST